MIMETNGQLNYNELPTPQLQIIRNKLLKSTCKEKYQEAIFLTLMFLNDSRGAYLILESEFFQLRIFKFLNKSNYNYFLGNELYNVYDSLFEFFKSHLFHVFEENNWLFHEINNIIKIFSTMIFYKPSSKILDEILDLIQIIFENYLKKQSNVHQSDIFHSGLNFLLLFSEKSLNIPHNIEHYQKVFHGFIELFFSEKINSLQRDDPYLSCLYIFLKQKQGPRGKIVDLITDYFPWKDEIIEKVKDDKDFMNKNQIIDQFLLIYEQKNVFQSYTNSISINKAHLYENSVNYHNIIMEEILDNEKIEKFSFNNYFFSLFQFQTYPLSKNIIKIIKKYAEKLIINEESGQKNCDKCFPQKEEIIRILDPSLKNLENKRPETILLIYFLLYYLQKKNESANKEKNLRKYDIIFLYDLPLQFHIYLFQMFFSDLVTNREEPFREEIELNDNLNKLIIIFIPILRSPAFLFTNFKKFYCRGNFISFLKNLTAETVFEIEEKFEKNILIDKLFEKILAVENKAKAFHQIKFLMAINSTKTSFFIIKLFIEQSQTSLRLSQASFLDPSYIMLIKKKYFEEPFFLEILLSSLNVLLINWEFFIKNSDFNNREGKTSYLLNTKCAIVQFLLEFIEESKTLKKHEEILCKYIHEICIEDYDLIRMVIFQGFNLKIIEKAVKYIEWMHACLFFIEELYKRNDTKTPEFSWILLANLIEKYPMKKSLDLCCSFLDYIHTFIPYIIKDSTLKIMNESLIKIKNTFPQLNDKIFNIRKILLEKLKADNPFFKFRESKEVLSFNDSLL